jgi:phosphoglycolate phosphatase-like HAD superfamily hydrolase
MEKVVLWDFDGTLAHRPGMWRGCLIETLDLHEPAFWQRDAVEAKRALRQLIRRGLSRQQPSS